ncbi:hypothetical protein D5086_033945 [Populus alba]|uniref:Uncharacterized protein n=1 Tax=Populus alba TaxID=43335 RepID=A0ACC4AI65_POPAL
MGKQPVKVKAVVYALSPFQQKVCAKLPGKGEVGTQVPLLEGGSGFWQASEVISMSDTSPVPRVEDDLSLSSYCKAAKLNPTNARAWQLSNNGMKSNPSTRINTQGC